MAVVRDKANVQGLETSHYTEHPSNDIRPGLISLNLGIVNTLDLHIIEEAKLDAINAIKDGHPILHNVEKNIIALLQTKIPRERHIARQTLEKIIDINPNHLNALADLEHIYRDLNRISDANSCRNAITNILDGKSEEQIESKQISLLEQGYAIQMAKVIINENTIDSKVLELQTIISSEIKNSSGVRKICLVKSSHHNKQTLQYHQDARKEGAQNEQMIRIRSSVQMFESALALFPGKELHPVWNFSFAKSLNQYCDLIAKMSEEDRIDRTDEIKEVTVKALKLFWKTVESADQDMSLYVARSYAFIGHIFTRRKEDLFIKKHISVFLSFIPNIEILLSNPSSILEKAYRLNPKDIQVLNRYGRSLWNESYSMKGIKKIEVLKRSEQILSKSIESDNKRNWFAYSSRQNVRKDIANLLPYGEVSSKIEYFQLAREDGLQCFNFGRTLKDMTILAEVCQNLAKCPDHTKYGPQFVQQEKRQLIVEAIDYLYYGMRLGDPIGYHPTCRMALCLADLGEMSKAIEWLKRAWLLSKSDSTFPILMLCSFLAMSIEEESRKTNTQISHLLKDFLYILKRVKDQYSCKDISNLYNFLHKRQGRYVLNVFISSINELSPFDSKTKEVMLDYVNHVLKLPKLKKCEQKIAEEVINLLKTVTIAENREENFLGIFESKSVKPSTSTQSISSDYKYDFFVCHSHENEDWVYSILLPHLENAYQEDDYTLKGCIANRDFIPGKSILSNIVEAIKSSSNIILILTCGFLKSALCQVEIEQALLEGSKDNRAIPVLLQDCKVPDELKHLTYIDLTNDDNTLSGLQRIKNAILLWHGETT